jgi:ankyrin repeat protein
MKNIKQILFVLLAFFSVIQFAIAMSGDSKHLKRLSDMSADEYFENKKYIQVAEAIESNNLDVISLKGLNLDHVGQEGMTLLMWSLVKKKKSGMKLLLETGADPNVITTDNAMRLSVIAKDSDYLQILLKHGGDVDSVNKKNGRSLIFYAAVNRRLENIKILKDAGADMNHQNVSGNTVLNYAISFKAYDLCLALFDMGVNPAIKNRWDNNSLDLLEQFGDKGVEKGSSNYDDMMKLRGEIKARLAPLGSMGSGSRIKGSMGSGSRINGVRSKESMRDQ